ncbi:MAG: DUF6428 family protein [Verrucomicrobiota bacterium]|nr:DUF6428 family protein [Verrucomicrobiota bacterium]
MKLSSLKTLLAQNSAKNVRFVLPTGTKIPANAHVTDVARIDKRFIDCGGTVRNESYCRLQAWFADDTEHRISGGVLAKVLEKASSVLDSESDLDVDVEYEAPFISQFPIEDVVVETEEIIFNLGVRHTTCLAQDVCLPSFAQEQEEVCGAGSKCC